MDEFMKENNPEEKEQMIGDNEISADEFETAEENAEEINENTDAKPLETEEQQIFNPVSYSPVNPINDYKPMNKGLKFFALILSAVIVLSATCFVGYSIGRNSVGSGKSMSNYANLAAKPADFEELTPAQVYEKVNKSIVGIMIYNSKGKGSQASGIIYSKDGYVITNDHIYSEVPAAKFKVYTHDGKEYDAKYVAGDTISDLAVLKIDSSGFKPAEFGNSDELFYGENVVAIGRPSDAKDDSSITKGIISAIDRRITTTSSYSARLIQTDSAINPGSSGGALVNMFGQVVGVTSSKLASVEYDAVGYAIPTTVMKRIVDELITEGKVVTRAKLGVTYTAIDSIAAEIGEYKTKGLLLASVAEDSGLFGKAAEGDYITHINGIEVTSDDVVLDIIEQSKAGDKISVTIYTSKGKTNTYEVELKANIGESSYVENESSKGESNSNGGTFDFPFGE